MMLNKYNLTEKFNKAEKYNCEWRKNTLRQPARREAGAVIRSFNCHLICMLRQKTLHKGIEGDQGKPLKQRGGLWKVRRMGRLPLQHFSHFTNFTVANFFLHEQIRTQTIFIFLVYYGLGIQILILFVRNNHKNIWTFKYLLHSVLVTCKANIHFIFDVSCQMSACLVFTTLVNSYFTVNWKRKNEAGVKGKFMELEHFKLNLLQSFKKNLYISHNLCGLNPKMDKKN